MLVDIECMCCRVVACEETYDEEKEVCCGFEVHDKDPAFMCCGGEWVSTKEYNCRYDFFAIRKDLGKCGIAQNLQGKVIEMDHYAFVCVVI